MSPPHSHSSLTPVLWVRLAMQGLALIGAGVAVFLAWGSVTGEQMPGCTGTSVFDCDHVLNSQWSSWFGVPVSFGGLLVYASLFVVLLFVGPDESLSRRRLSWGIAILLIVTAAGSGLWFLSLQAIERSFCLYCIIVHGCGLIVLLLALWKGPLSLGRCFSDPVSLSVRSRLIWVVSGGVGITLLIVGQLLDPVPRLQIEQSSEAAIPDQVEGRSLPPVESASLPNQESTLSVRRQPVRSSSRLVSYGPNTIDVYKVPVLGSREAPWMLAKLFDYTCPHCRTLHHQLEYARTRLGPKMAVALLPVPLDNDCNRHIEKTAPQHRHACELAQISLAVWQEDPHVFVGFHEWMFETKIPRTAIVARRKAVELIGAETLDKWLLDRTISKRILRNIVIFRSMDTEKRSLPTTMIWRVLIKGPGPNQNTLLEKLAELFGVPVPLE